MRRTASVTLITWMAPSKTTISTTLLGATSKGGLPGKLANTSAIQEIISYEIAFFNNTIYNFVRASRRQAPQAGRDKFLGNVIQSMGLSVFRDADPARKAAGNEADAGRRRNQYALETDAYARNVFHDIGLGEGFGVLEPSGRWIMTLAAFRETLERYKPLAATVGVMADQPPLRNPAAHDFRPATNSAARGLGAKVFVPWSLYETVGEWHFCPIQGDPTRILDEHWCMAPYYTGRDDYYKFPTYPLRGVNIGMKDYQTGPLENWTTGALHFNGRDRYAVLANADITRPVRSSRHPRPSQRRGPEESAGLHFEFPDRDVLQDGSGTARCDIDAKISRRWLRPASERQGRRDVDRGSDWRQGEPGQPRFRQ